METINFKPSTKVEVFMLILAAIIFFIGIFLAFIHISLLAILFIPLLIVIISITSIITKSCTNYSITSENKIILEYSFISKYKKIIRIDQITSVSHSQNLLEKMLNLGSIRFGIFGQNSIYQVQAGQAQQGRMQLPPIFVTIKDSKNIYKKFSSILKLEENNQTISQEKPSLSPKVFSIILNIVFGIIFVIATLFAVNKINIADTNLLIYIIGGSFIFITFISFIINIVSLFRLKSTKYKIKDDCVEYSHNYALSSKKIRYPLYKITNTQTAKNVISHAIFGIGKVLVFTGGSNDISLPLLKNYEKFSNILSKQYSKKSNIKEDNSAGFKTKPSSSYFATTFLYSSIICTLICAPIFIYLNQYKFIGFIIIGLYLFILLMKYILWKNTTYEFYHNKVVDKSGIINIRTKEIYFKNVKHIELRKNLFFDRILNQGTIYIYTAGTGFMDNKINSIKQYKEVYEELKHEIQ